MAQKLDVSRMRIASPCRVGWDSMIGDDRARFCRSCDRHVYNIVGLSRTEIESLVETTEGRLCVRMYQRADETVLTHDCPIGLRAIRKRAATFAGAALSTLLGLFSIGYGQDSRDSSRSGVALERVKIDSGWSQISGFVTDLSGAVVPGVDVRLKGIGFEKLAKTDAEGRFRFESLRPDLRYELSLEREGFAKYKITDLDPANGEGLTVKVSMQPGSPPYVPIDVVPLPEVPTGSSSVSSVMSTRPLNSCPYSDTQIVERVKVDSKRGQLSGQIFDPHAAVVPGIKLRLQFGKRVVDSVTSNAEGFFFFDDIKPAVNYTLRIDGQQGWKKQLIEGITISAGEKISYSVCIQVDNVYEVVGLFAEPVEMVLTDGAKPTETFVPRQTYPLPPTMKETPARIWPRR